MKYQFRPRKSFKRSLSYLSKIDSSIVDEIREAVLILLNGERLSEEYSDHELKGNFAVYREFHLRDTPKGTIASEINNIVVVYKIKDQDLVLIAVDIGSRQKLFHGHYRKPK